MRPSARPLFARRLRALWRKLYAWLSGGPPVQGFVDGCVAGEIRGWAMTPREPGRRVHVVAIHEGRVVAEALADGLRMDLIQDGRGDGRHGFRLKLPPALLDGASRRVQVAALATGPRVRLARGELEVGTSQLDETGPPAAGPPRARPGAVVSVLEPPPAGALALVICGPSDEMAAAATRASASTQSGPPFQVIELAALRAQGMGGPLRAQLTAAETVAFAAAGAVLDPAASLVLGGARTLADVVTWDGPEPAARRAEARALGVLLGERLGAFAVRGHALSIGGGAPLDALLQGDLGALELSLAARPDLRWSHLPARLAGASAPPRMRLSSDIGFTPPGFRRRTGGLAPKAAPARWSVGLWPAWSEASERTLRSLLTLTPGGMEIEVLADPVGARALQDLPAGVTVRPIDVAQGAGSGAWMAALGAAATGDFVLICQAGLVFEHGAEALEDMAAWSQSPLVGALTAEIRPAEGQPLAGLAMARVEAGWAARSAFFGAGMSPRRPVLAAPSSLLGVSRAKLAAIGGFEGGRLDAAHLELALRLRRMGASSVLLGDLGVAWTGPGRPAGEAEGAALAVFEAEELAAAACAYPARDPAP